MNNKRISLKKFMDKHDLVLCNNVADIDTDLERYYNNKEICQYYIIGISNDTVEYYKERYPQLYFQYSEVLDCYIFCTTFCGISWDDVYIEDMQPQLYNE